jgi:pimeloyl-ACP methyl ester carboxylesterase/membrane protein DedA with SNARE-associated domain
MFNSGMKLIKYATAGWRRYVLFYLLLVAISNAILMAKPDPGPADPGQQSVLLKGDKQTPLSDSEIKIRYIDTGDRQSSATQQPVLLLIHGSPLAASQGMLNFVQALKPAGRVIAPDLPGFGRSTHQIPDYGYETQATYLAQLIRQLAIPKVHLIAYSMGAGTALHLAQMVPERIASLTLLSAIGVQEYELLGQYHLNHALHGAQLALLWMLHHALPHMGLINYLPFSMEFARNFYDADQRPLRTLLSDWKAPMLIIHGRRDQMVPYIAAIEHHRLVPQSELITYPDGHLMFRNQPALVASDITGFIQRAEIGFGETRSMASPERITAAAQPLQLMQVKPAGVHATLVFMLLIAFATLISEDLACIGAGLLTARGVIGLLPAVGGAFSGIVGGDLLLFAAGRFLGRPALTRRPLKWFLKPEDIENSSHWFSARGPAIILASRFIPGSRLPTFFSAGMLGHRMGPFIFYFCLAAALWTPALVGLSAIVGQKLLSYYHLIQAYTIWAVLGLAILIWASINSIPPLFTNRGRRLWIARYRRLTRWEFWPIYIFYLPMVCYIIYLGLRYRNLTLFTSANPGIPAGGIMGESKSDILRQLKPGQGHIARYIKLDRTLSLHQQTILVQTFLQKQQIDFPLVFKPDVGERGEGVAIVTSMEQADRYLSRTVSDTIVQEYIDGNEFGVFYYRYPGARRGNIFSITDKRLLTLVGDGHSTLEKLILEDDRAMCLAPVHFRKHKRKLHTVPAKGEKIALVEVGTHCRGAMFLNANHLITPQLEQAIDDLSRRFKGFYFGRYDIRTHSVDAFQKGQNFTVLELNGVTSEATHIYQPGNRLTTAYNTLMHQWRLAFEIGAANTRRGIRPLAFKELVNLMRYITLWR